MSKKKKSNSLLASQKELTPEELKSYLGIVYARVSSRSQETEGSGLQSQESRCKAYLDSKGIIHHESFLDSFTGGGDFLQRPAMRKLLSYIDKHPKNKFLVVFDDLSRFARDVQFHIKLRTEFKIRGVLLHCLNFKLEDSIEGEFIETLIACQNEYHRKKNRAQVIERQNGRFQSGHWGFRPVVGYKKIRDKLLGTIEVQNEKAPFVKEALEGFANLRFLHKVDAVKYLQSNNVISKKQSSYKGIAAFDKMLREIFYAGFIEKPERNIKRRLGNHEPLISLETFEKNQKRLNSSHTAFVRRDVRDDFELRGLVNCAHCNQKYTGAPSKGKLGVRYPYYKCANKTCQAYGKSIRAEKLHCDFEELLSCVSPCSEIMSLTDAILDDVWANTLKDKDRAQSKHIGQKRLLEEQLEALMHQVIRTTNEVVRSQYEKQIEKIGLEIESLEQKINSAYDYKVPNRTSRVEVLNVLKNPALAWENYNVHQKQRFFSFIFEENLSYSKENGYRTPLYTLPLRIFEQINTQNVQNVEVAGIEPAS